MLGIKLQVIFNWLRTTTTEILLKLEAVRKNWFIPVLQRAGNHWERICQECSVLLSCNSPPPPAPPAHSSWCAVLLPRSLARPSPTSSKQEGRAPALGDCPAKEPTPTASKPPFTRSDHLVTENCWLHTVCRTFALQLKAGKV